MVGQLQTNCYVIQEGRDAIVVDPGDEPVRIARFLKSLEAKLTVILATHTHFDHVLGVDELRKQTSARFVIHQDDLPMLESMQDRMQRYMGLQGPSPPKVDGYLKEGDVFKIGKSTVEVLHTPGHSPGSVSLKGDRYVMTGDALFNQSIGRTDLPGGNMRTLVESIREKLFSLDDATIVYPGHGPETTIGDEKLSNPFVGQAARINQ